MKTIILALLISISAQAKEAVQISFFGITHHGIEIPPWEPKIMSNKITKNGIWAYNPQFNFTKIKDDGSFFNTSFVIDCYGSAAINGMLGKRIQYSDKLFYGYAYGLYFRNKPGDRTDQPFVIAENYQLFPTAAGLLQYKITENVTLRLTGNYFINFFDIAFEF